MLKRDPFVAPVYWKQIAQVLISVSQSINESFILARYIQELKTLSKYERV